MPPPSVTVIIPTHNAGAHLGECLQSVVRQSLDDLEILCIDDGSTDDTAAILDNFAAGDVRITVLRQASNVGAGTTRNIGLERARGCYIAFMDGDDRYPDEHALARLHAKATEHGVDICGGSLFTFHGDTVHTRVPLQHFPSEGFIDYRDYQYEGGFYRYVFRKSFLDRHRIRFPAYRRHQDSVFLVKAMTAAMTFYAITDHVYAYRKGHKTVAWDLNATRDHFSGIREILSIATRHRLGILHKRMATNIGVSLRRRLPRPPTSCFFADFDAVFSACLDSLHEGSERIPFSYADKLVLRSKYLAWRSDYAYRRFLARFALAPPPSTALAEDRTSGPPRGGTATDRHASRPPLRSRAESHSAASHPRRED